MLSLRTLPKRSRLSETNKGSLLILDFIYVPSSSNATYLQNLTLLKNVINSQTPANVIGKLFVVLFVPSLGYAGLAIVQ